MKKGKVVRHASGYAVVLACAIVGVVISLSYGANRLGDDTLVWLFAFFGIPSAILTFSVLTTSWRQVLTAGAIATFPPVAAVLGFCGAISDRVETTILFLVLGLASTIAGLVVFSLLKRVSAFFVFAPLVALLSAVLAFWLGDTYGEEVGLLFLLPAIGVTLLWMVLGVFKTVIWLSRPTSAPFSGQVSLGEAPSRMALVFNALRAFKEQHGVVIANIVCVASALWLSFLGFCEIRSVSDSRSLGYERETPLWTYLCIAISLLLVFSFASFVRKRFVLGTAVNALSSVCILLSIFLITQDAYVDVEIVLAALGIPVFILLLSIYLRGSFTFFDLFPKIVIVSVVSSCVLWIVVDVAFTSSGYAIFGGGRAYYFSNRGFWHSLIALFFFLSWTVQVVFTTAKAIQKFKAGA